MSDRQNTELAPKRPWRAKTAILALGVFAVGTDGFVIVGLLPEIHKTLHVSTAVAGQMVTSFAVAYALMGPVLAALTGKWSRRSVLVTGIMLLGVGNAVTALAHDFALILASRTLAGAGAALFIANAVATAAHLAGDQRRGSAIAMVTAGSTTSLVLGAPLGTVIGGAWGWRAAIWFVTGFAVVVAAAIAVLLPSTKLGDAATLRQRVAPLTDHRVLRILAVTLLAFIGIYLPFTYMSAVFASAIEGTQNRLALLLLVFGIAATAGNLTVGWLVDRYDSRRVVIGATLGVAAVFLVMLPIREVYVLVAICHALSGFVSFSVIGPQQHRIIPYAPPGGASLVTSLNTSTAYLGNFISSIVGGVVISTAGSATYLLPIGAVFAALAAFFTWWPSRSGGRRDAAGAERTTQPTTVERSR